MEEFRAITRVARKISPAARGGNLTFKAVALSSALCCLTAGLGGCKGQSIGYSGISGAEAEGIIIGTVAVVAVGTIAAVEVHKGHHTVKGCVSSGQSGLELQNRNDGKSYALSGETTGIKSGDLVRLRGNKLKKDKHSTVEQTFAVTKVGKDYGPCQVASGPSGKATSP